jgi:two-component system, sensor histidine kinase PdtaS
VNRLRSIRVLVPLVLLGLAVCLTLVFTLDNVRTANRTIEAETRGRLESLGNRNSARLEFYYAGGDRASAKWNLSLLVTEPYYVRSLVFEDAEAPTIKIDASATESAASKEFNAGMGATLAAARSSMSSVIKISGDRQAISGAFPFKLGLLPGEIKPSRAGVLYLELGMGDPKAARVNETLGRVVSIVGIMLLLILAIGLSLDFFVSHRLARLTAMTQTIAEGHYEGRVEIHGADEIAELGMAFNRMAAEIQVRNKTIERELDNREVLIKELYHRTKNNLQVICSFLELQAGEIDDPKLLSCLEEMKNRIYSMSLVHQMLYRSKDLSRVNMKDYLGELSGLLLSGYAAYGERVKLDLDLEEIYLPIDSAIPCGLVANELLSNALKYAFPGEASGRVRLLLSRGEGGTVILLVADDGVGMPEGFDYRKQGHLGLQTVVALGEGQLHGKVDLARGKGLTWTLEFPGEEEAARGPALE